MSRLFLTKGIRLCEKGYKKREHKIRSEDFNLLKGYADSGAIKPVIDRSYTLEEIVEAHRYVEKGHKKGNVTITVGWGKQRDNLA